MLKRIIIIMISLAIFSNLVVSASDRAEDNPCNNIIRSIAPYADENTNISRENCIASVMQLVGIDKNTAAICADMDFDQPVFYDIDNDLNAGYIILAKFSGVATGVNLDTRNIGNFEPNRDVTTKECLAFMLRCLKDSTSVEWENIIPDAEEVGLLQSDEVQNLNGDEAHTGSTFKTLLERMLNMNRYLYWPTEEPHPGHAKSMQVDTSKSIKYVDWIVESRSNWENT